MASLRSSASITAARSSAYPVHVVRRRGLTRPAMTATVVRDDAEALLREEEHLAVPSIRAQGPAMRERYDRTLTPIFVINLCSVFGSDRAHRKPFLVIVRCRHRC